MGPEALILSVKNLEKSKKYIKNAFKLEVNKHQFKNSSHLF